MKKWSLLLLVVTLVVALLVLTGCSTGDTAPNRTLNAKIRYFDGTSEMIELSKAALADGNLIRLVSKSGDIIYVGPNNVIILDEEVRP